MIIFRMMVINILYISEKLSFEKLDTNKYTIKCQFINLTNEDVTIEKLHIYLSGKKDSNHYIYDDQYLYDIKVPAGGKYDLIINDYYYPIEFGGYIKSCIIGGKECNSIQYSPDGVTFKGPTSLLTTIILLSIGIGGNVICIVMMNKNKKQNMNKVSNS